jgi:uncharacterized membrane protein YhaH (DUF805 family)
MNMQEAVRSVLSQYASFSGRARRSEYWFFYLAIVIVSVVASILDLIIGMQILGWIVAAATIVPSISASARRLHDTGRSGWWQLIGIIPVIGWILLIVWLATDSNPGDNQYGLNPKGAGLDAYGSAKPIA